MLYPIKFKPIYKEKIWGGRNLEKIFKRNLPENDIGESWEICCRKDGMSIISNGQLKGMTLKSAIDEYKKDLIGTLIYDDYNDFPLLIKFIDANDKLSVQVHPDDDYAAIYENDKGKCELWYVIDAKPGAKLIYGLKRNLNKEEFIEAIKNRNILNMLNEVEVKPMDVFYIPPGTVHSIEDGILIAEIQQNSDTTYRIYDWDRALANGKPRELHMDKAINVIDFNSINNQKISRQKIENNALHINILSKNKYFTVEEILNKNNYINSTDYSRFNIYMIIDGLGYIEYKNGTENLKAGDTILIPASLGQYSILGYNRLLKIYI